MYNDYMTEHWQQYTNKGLLVYVALIITLAGYSAWQVIDAQFSWPAPITWLLGSSSLLLVWHCGVKFPYLGLTSMERLVQFHLLLTLPISETLIILIIPSLIMPFVNKAYRMNSYHVALIRAVNNLAMNVLMMLTGYLILNFGLDLPLTTLTWHNIWVISISALAMQVVNITMIFFYFQLDRKKIHRLFTSAYLLLDLVFVPVGVLSALLWHANDPSLFALFAFFITVLLIIFRGLNKPEHTKETQYLQQGTDYQINTLDLDHVCQSISQRSDQLFNAQGLFLLAVDEEQYQILIEENNSTVKNLSELLKQSVNTAKFQKSTSHIEGQHLHIMQAAFIDQQGIFARLILIRDNQIPFNEADLDLLRLFVRRFRTDLSYAITYERLKEYKNNLETKVAIRTRQLEQANKEKSQLVNRLKKTSQTDALTGLYNRRYFDTIIKHLKIKPPNQLSLAVCDIDYFKQVNDHCGHDTGDWILQTLAAIMKQWSEAGITLIRYGGEEFVILLSKLTPANAEQSLEKLRSNVEQYGWPDLTLKHNITISIGVAHFPETAMEQLFDMADKGLYQAKTNGKNQLVKKTT